MLTRVAALTLALLRVTVKAVSSNEGERLVEPALIQQPSLLRRENVSAPQLASSSIPLDQVANKWGDANCHRWAKEDPARCKARNYKVNCAKACSTFTGVAASLTENGSAAAGIFTKVGNGAHPDKNTKILPRYKMHMLAQRIADNVTSRILEYATSKMKKHQRKVKGDDNFRHHREIEARDGGSDAWTGSLADLLNFDDDNETDMLLEESGAGRTRNEAWADRLLEPVKTAEGFVKKVLAAESTSQMIGALSRELALELIPAAKKSEDKEGQAAGLLEDARQKKASREKERNNHREMQRAINRAMRNVEEPSNEFEKERSDAAQQLLEVQEDLLYRLSGERANSIVELAKKSTKQLVSKMTQLATKCKELGVEPSTYSKAMASKLASLVVNLQTPAASAAAARNTTTAPLSAEAMTLGKQLAKEATVVLMSQKDATVEKLAWLLMEHGRLQGHGKDLMHDLRKTLDQVGKYFSSTSMSIKDHRDDLREELESSKN